MIRRYQKTIFFLLIFSVNLSASNPMVVVSIDGLRPDAIDRARARMLQELIAAGTVFGDARTVRPSITLPSHTSMITGLLPSQHGIDWNDYRPEYGPVRFPTALEIVKNAGFHTIMIVAKDKLITLNRPNSVNYFEKTDKEGADVAAAFERYVKRNGLPDVSFLHLPDPDTKGHKFMWMSPSYLSAVRDADAALRSIVNIAIASTKKTPFFLITADHGGFAFGHAADIDLNMQIPFIVKGEHIPAGEVRNVPIHNFDVAATILDNFHLPIPNNWVSRPIPIPAPRHKDDKIRRQSLVELRNLPPVEMF